ISNGHFAGSRDSSGSDGINKIKAQSATNQVHLTCSSSVQDGGFCHVTSISVLTGYRTLGSLVTAYRIMTGCIRLKQGCIASPGTRASEGEEPVRKPLTIGCAIARFEYSHRTQS